jgi:hypothetical protein
VILNDLLASLSPTPEDTQTVREKLKGVKAIKLVIIQGRLCM